MTNREGSNVDNGCHCPGSGSEGISSSPGSGNQGSNPPPSSPVNHHPIVKTLQP